MSDLAIIDLDNPELSTTGVTATVLAPSGQSMQTTAASVSGLTAGLTGITAHQTDSSNSRAIHRSFGATDGLVVINPSLTATKNLRRLANLVLRARVEGKPVALVGLSAFGLTTRRSRALARFIVKHSDLVLVRDEASADVLLAVGVEGPFRMGADPAWAQMDELYAAKEPVDQVVVALDVDENEIDLVALEENLAATLGEVEDAGLSIVLQPWQESGREATNALFAKKVNARLGGRATVATAPQSLRESRELYAGSRMVLATRMHAVMAAAVAGSRTVSLTTGPTLTRFSESLALPSLAASASSSAMTTAVLDALDSEPATALAVREQIERAKGSIALVRLLLTEGADTAPASIDPLPLYPNLWR